MENNSKPKFEINYAEIKRIKELTDIITAQKGRRYKISKDEIRCVLSALYNNGHSIVRNGICTKEREEEVLGETSR